MKDDAGERSKQVGFERRDPTGNNRLNDPIRLHLPNDIERL